MRKIYEDPETEAILLVDAENAFKVLYGIAAILFSVVGPFHTFRVFFLSHLLSGPVLL